MGCGLSWGSEAFFFKKKKKSKALRGEGAHGTWAHRVNLERAEKYGEKLKSIHSFYTGVNKAKIVEINSVWFYNFVSLLSLCPKYVTCLWIILWNVPFMALILEHMNISARTLLDSFYDFHHEKQHSDKLSYAKSSMLLYRLKTYSLLIFHFF